MSVCVLTASNYSCDRPPRRHTQLRRLQRRRLEISCSRLGERSRTVRWLLGNVCSSKKFSPKQSRWCRLPQRSCVVRCLEICRGQCSARLLPNISWNCEGTSWKGVAVAVKSICWHLLNTFCYRLSHGDLGRYIRVYIAVDRGREEAKVRCCVFDSCHEWGRTMLPWSVVAMVTVCELSCSVLTVTARVCPRYRVDFLVVATRTNIELLYVHNVFLIHNWHKHLITYIFGKKSHYPINLNSAKPVGRPTRPQAKSSVKNVFLCMVTPPCGLFENTLEITYQCTDLKVSFCVGNCLENVL